MPGMHRNLATMAANRFDLLIIGGGITGASIAWDASLRGLSVALIDKHDFACATTASSSKLIHGGLRYLRNFQIGLVRESLRERRIWETIAPHMVMPLRFVLPSAGWRAHLTLRAGLLLYDLLSFDRNLLEDPDKWLPGHSAMSLEAAIAEEPILRGAAASGALSYYDCQMHTPERLALEFIQGAAQKGAQVANYTQAVRLNSTNGVVIGVRVRDQLSGAEYDIPAEITINAAGPWADHIAADGGASGHVKLLRSKGIHVITRPLSKHAIAVIGAEGHFFVLPWRGYSLIATTDTPYTNDPDELRVTEEDITELLNKVNRGLPAANLVRSDVRHAYAGLRPLVADPADPRNDTYGASRGSEIFDHAKADGRAGLISAIGGKWTTSRHLAEQVVDMALGKLGRADRTCVTANTPLIGGAIPRFNRFVEQARMRHASLPRGVITHLALAYGTRLDAIIALVDEEPAMGEQLTSHLPEIAAQIRYAVRSELALTLEDAVFRRTGLCTLGHPGNPALNTAARIMAQELGWSESEQKRQIDKVEQQSAVSEFR